MKAINLSHSIQPVNNKPIAMTALSISVLLLLLCGFYFSTSSARLAELKQQQESYSQSSTARIASMPLTEGEQSELEAVNLAIKDIVRPWPRLFKALETVKLKQIRVLSIDPNAKSKTLRIAAVTRDVDQMLVYINGLKQQVIFDTVSLNSTEAVNLHGQPATQFELSVSWQDHGASE